MEKCSVRSCNEAAIAGFAEEIEVGSVTFPRRIIPGATRYWCLRHSCLALETQGKLGHSIDLSTPPAGNGQGDAEPLLSTLYVAELDAPGGIRKTLAPQFSATGDRRKRDRFRADGMAEVNIPNCQILFRGLTSDLSYAGCYIQSPAYLGADLGEQVEVRFSVSDVHFRASAKVTAIRRGKGAGFEFLHVEEEAQNNLNTLIEKLSSPTSVPAEGSPELASTELAASKDRH
jgi:hypothetical protein